MPPVNLLPSALSELFAQVSSSGKITLADRYGILAALLSNNMSAEEQCTIDRLLHALKQRRVQVVNELSAEM
ncbi:hypothetical protein H6F90_15350 [Trichocoleus sp. FACHB-591]|uniref:hypothetical protein n=1 Tax=Trichocoleus sp. FACHB-591 TaxID=2692872 RepID=UPI0016846C0E|nr:hypothetical protein [Trichocoleus sp. FACHB-591]MBD2096514.1 hypothetical protein [Trichocoleus sp. FACHB-591]